MKLLLADDHQLIRQGLRMLIGARIADAQFVEVGSYDEARSVLMRDDDIQLAVIDIRMQGATDTMVLEQLARHFVRVPLVVLSGFLRPETVQLLLLMPSVYAVVTKDSSPDRILRAISEALAGRKLGDANRLLDADPMDIQGDEGQSLPPRLAEIHNLLREGQSNKSIARLLNLTEGTVKNYVSEIFKQLRVRNRVQAAQVARPGDANAA